MSELCPFCTTEIPQGAVVCRGCGANKEFKAPNWIALPAFLVMLVSGVPAGFAFFLNGQKMLGVGLFSIAIGAFVVGMKSRRDIWSRPR